MVTFEYEKFVNQNFAKSNFNKCYVEIIKKYRHLILGSSKENLDRMANGKQQRERTLTPWEVRK
jgi:hypothetical protein